MHRGSGDKGAFLPRLRVNAEVSDPIMQLPVYSASSCRKGLHSSQNSRFERSEEER
jgi:hypothetical protein